MVVVVVVVIIVEEMMVFIVVRIMVVIMAVVVVVVIRVVITVDASRVGLRVRLSRCSARPTKLVGRIADARRVVTKTTRQQGKHDYERQRRRRRG